MKEAPLFKELDELRKKLATITAILLRVEIAANALIAEMRRTKK